MMNHFWFLIFITFLTINGLSDHIVKRSITWNDNWAFACDFHGNDLTNVQIRSEDCSEQCAQTSGCTHFTWTTHNDGACWMKSVAVSKSDAYSTDDQSMVCGVLDGPVILR